ncbi:hypothetical protein ACLB2K_034018 [Fragaria x ananassa]
MLRLARVGPVRLSNKRRGEKKRRRRRVRLASFFGGAPAVASFMGFISFTMTIRSLMRPSLIRSCPDPDSDQFWRYFGFDLVTGQGRLSTNSILGCGNSEQYFAAGTSEHTKLLIDHSAIHGLVGLTTSRDHRTRVEAVTALDKWKDNIVEESILRQLVQLLLHLCPSVLNHALRAVSNITVFAPGDTNHKIECIIHAGLLACLGSVLANNHQKSIKKEVCRIIIDISHCGRSTQVTIEAGLIHARVSLLHTSDLEMKKVAIKTIIAVSKMCNNDQLRSLANDCRKPLLKLLGCKDPDIVAMCLEMLQFFDGEFGFIGRDYGVAQQLIDLLAHKNVSICKSARSLLTSLGNALQSWMSFGFGMELGRVPENGKYFALSQMGFPFFANPGETEMVNRLKQLILNQEGNIHWKILPF